MPDPPAPGDNTHPASRGENVFGGRVARGVIVLVILMAIAFILAMLIFQPWDDEEAGTTTGGVDDGTGSMSPVIIDEAGKAVRSFHAPVFVIELPSQPPLPAT